ncbi:hypothetical protein HPB50_027150 [Hyalomma asiaticum]|uniref:Uncharacterized protein n=1 Tax=Hyalomma asiaticum TaxID=266040 RepID=A0ACB7TPD3_HYAAI|nr:hypothetical protein HPB50_027150 [Hyalomma asiaticum]
MIMSQLTEDGASVVVHSNMASVDYSVLIPETGGGGVVSSSAASPTGSTLSAVVPTVSSFASGDVVGTKDAVTTSWTQELDCTEPALGDCSLTSCGRRGTSAELLNLSNSSDGAPVCRICFFGDSEQPLLDVCECRGTIGFVHRDCLEQWIQRSKDPQCPVCHFRFTVRKQPQPAWRLLSSGEARRPVLRYLAMGVLFVLGITFVFTLAWLYALCLASRVGEKLAVTIFVLLAVQNIAWLYFPFVIFKNLHKAYKNWREGSACLKLVLSTDPPKDPAWSNFLFWRSGGGSREPVLADAGAQ